MCNAIGRFQDALFILNLIGIQGITSLLVNNTGVITLIIQAFC